ncbi:11225_t:CDS:2, partial [Entrophospora sp. SA101]
MSVSTKFLVTGMLISGVCNTILNKLQDMQCVENCDQETNKKYFEQPVWQTLNMFIGETLCFLAGNNQTSIDNNDITSNADNIIVEEDIN